MLLFDIQGVGSAWYTFKYSMSFAMEACAKAGIPFVVLDRPNPLGGLVVEGPYLNLGRIFRHRLPLRHGMTYGELATMLDAAITGAASLSLVAAAVKGTPPGAITAGCSTLGGSPPLPSRTHLPATSVH